MLEKFQKTLIDWPIFNPRKSLTLGCLLFFLFAPFALNLSSDFGAKVWFSQEDSHIVALNDFEKTFGNDESFVIVIDNKKNIFNSNFVKKLSNITEGMWKVPEVIRVDSLANFHWSYARGDEIITEPFLPDEEHTNDEYIKNREKDALSHKDIPGVYLSRDGQSATIFGNIVYNPKKEPNYKKIYNGVEKLISEQDNVSGLDFHYLGQPALSHVFQDVSFRDLRVMIPLLLFLVIAYLIFCFRSFLGVFIPLLVIGSASATLAGMASLIDIKFNSLTMILPSILIAIGIADSVHLLATYYTKLKAFGRDKIKACRATLEKNLWPIFLTSLSTAIGFFSLISSDIAPVSELGLLAGVGTFLALVYSYLLVVPILILVKEKKNTHKQKHVLIEPSLIHSYMRWVDLHKIKLMITFFILCFVSIGLALQNEVNSNPYKYFKEGNPITEANNYALQKYGGIAGPEIIIDSGDKEGAKDPNFLKKVESFQNWLETHSYVNRVVSIINILKEMNQSLFGGDPKEYRLSSKQDVIAQELFLYTLGLPAGMDISNRIDIDNRKVRLSVLWSIQDSKSSLEKMDHIEKKAEELGLNIAITGKAVLFQRMNSYVVYTFFSSMGVALLLITLILIFVLGSFKHGLLSLAPNFVPIIIGAGFLTIISTPIDIGCAIVASVTLGIAVDDTIHFLSHYNRLVRLGKSRFDALVEVLSSTGVALFITTLILVSCFGLFIFADLVPNVNFGILSALVLSFALICDVVFLPALILCFEKETQRKKT